MNDQQPIDVDVFIPTGCEATPDQVAAMLADPLHPLEAVDALPERQRPSVEQVEAVAAERGIKGEALTELRAKITTVEAVDEPDAEPEARRG